MARRAGWLVDDHFPVGSRGVHRGIGISILSQLRASAFRAKIAQGGVGVRFAFTWNAL